MGFIESVIEFFLGLFGTKKATLEPALPAGQSGTSVAFQRTSSSDFDDVVDDKPMDRRKYAEACWRKTQQTIAAVESKGRAHLGGLDPTDLVGFHLRMMEFNEHEMNGNSGDDAARAIGYRNRDHWHEVCEYISCKWSHFGTNDEGQPDVLVRVEFTNAWLQAGIKQFERKHGRIDASFSECAREDPG